MVLLSITPLLDGVLRLDIIAPFHTSGPPLLQFHLAIEQWGYYVESQNPTDYRYWSIPFTSHYITMATKTYYEPKEEAVPWLVGIDMQKFICGYGANFIGSSYVSCVGIGC